MTCIMNKHKATTYTQKRDNKILVADLDSSIEQNEREFNELSIKNKSSLEISKDLEEFRTKPQKRFVEEVFKTCEVNENKSNFEKEIEGIYPWVLFIAKKYCSSTEDAEDLAGETICKILENREKFSDGKPLKPWCVAILKNTYITMHNKKTLIGFVGYESIPNLNNSSNSLGNLYFNELLSIIRSCTKKTKCMECVILYAKGYSYDEISLILNIPIGTVMSRISFGRKILKQELSDMHLYY